MSLSGHVAWFAAFMLKEFLSDFVKRTAEIAADKMARAKALYRGRGRR